MTSAQLRDAGVGLSIASLVATLAVSSNPGRRSVFSAAFQIKSPDEEIPRVMARIQRTWSSVVFPHTISFMFDVSVTVCS